MAMSLSLGDAVALTLGRKLGKTLRRLSSPASRVARAEA